MATDVQTTGVASAALAELIGKIRDAVRASDDAATVASQAAGRLQPYLDRTDFLTEAQLEPDPIKYRQHILHVEPDGSFSIVALVWLPGQATPIHDHVSWCVVGVHRGQEHETAYELSEQDGEPCLVVTGSSVSPCGDVCALTPPGDIHHVMNAGDELAVSLHIYGADIGVLGSSIRRRYDLPVRDVR
jgi:3-mercaptopropionate dioxygenase